MARHHCPNCSSPHAWSVRRNARKCKKCRREWTPRRSVVPGIRADAKAWKRLIIAVLRYRTIAAIRLHTKLSHPVILAMYARLRAVMESDMPDILSGTVEVDETYIGPQWRNRPWSIRKHGTKKGRGTSKQPVFGLLERGRGVVIAFLVPDAKKRTLMPIIVRHVKKGSLICSDGYQLYQETPREGFRHAFVDHKRHEYARGKIHSNAMEGFWGLLKRRLKTTGGIRRDRLHLYVAEEAWRYNQRKLPETKKVERLLGLLRQVGG